MDRFPPPHPIYPPVIYYGPAPIPLRKEPHIPLTPKTGMRREEIERRLSEIDVTPEEKAAWNAKYQKPSTGIPKTDLSSGVQASLGKADTALQEHQSLDGYATEEWVEDQGYLTEHQDITGKVDKSALFDNPDTTPKVKSSLLPSYVDDVLEFASLSVFPTTGETGKIYVALDTNKIYRWGGTQYVQVGGDEQAQADWAQTNIGAPDFIKNKPTIPAAQVQANWNETNTSSKAYIQNKPTIPTVPTNVSAFTNDAGYLTQHQSLAAYRTAAAQDAIDGAQDAAIAAKYTKPATGIPASDLAAGVIPTVPSLPISIENGGTGATNKNTALANLGAVKKSGDTMTGDLEVVRTFGSRTGGTVTVRSIADEIGEALVKVAAPDGAEIYLDAASGYNPSIAVKRAGGELKEIEVPNNNGILALQEGIAPAFSTSSTYAVGDYVTHEGLLYKCTTAVSTAGAWNAANWSAVAVIDEMGRSLVHVAPGTVQTSLGYWTVGTDSLLYEDGEILFAAVHAAPPSTGGALYLNVNNGGNHRVYYWDPTSGLINPPRTAWKFADIVPFMFKKKLDGTNDCWLVSGVGKIASDAYPTSNGVSSPGTSTAYARGDHVHPTDTTRAPIASPAFTGTPTAPTAAAGTNTTQVATTAFVQTEARYAFASPTPSVSGTGATVACEDRAINDFTVATGITSLTITPPAAVTGRARDFFCRVTLTDSSLPTVTLSGGTIDIGSTEVAGMTQGVNLLMFTEIASGHWMASRRSAS